MLNKKIINGYMEMTKPSIMMLVLVTTTLGFYFAGQGIHDWGRLVLTLIGAALTCAGSAVLNHYVERDADALMNRTKKRPLPTALISASSALSFGVILILIGISLLFIYVNLLTSFLSLLTAFLYVLVYTPMKRISWLNTTIGAIPGAIPVMGGWAAATNSIDIGAWVLFFIMFAWQHPHFYAIAWLFKEDYARAGFKMLPVVEPDGKRTFRHVIAYCLLLLLVSILPIFLNMSGWIYLTGAIILGLGYLYTGIIVRQTKSILDAKKLLGASILYLPLLLGFIILDVIF